MRSLQILALSVLLLCADSLNAASSFTLGSNDAQRCYEESLLPFSEDGRQYCDRAINQGDLTRRDLAATYSNRGVILAANGKYLEAIEDHNLAIDLVPSLGQAYINRGNAFYYTRDFEKALADYDMAMNLKATPAYVPHYNTALTLIRLKRKAEARAALERALVHAPESTKIKEQLEHLGDI
jgi:tetratricopeptide (TPR) repeat protein